MLTVTDPAFAGTQEGTLHFHYLRWENGGLLHVARDLDEHVQQLGRALQQGEEDARHVRDFVQRFTRPFGLDQPAAPLVAQGIEELGRLGAADRPHDRNRHARPPRRPLPGRADDDRRLVHARRRAACAEDGARGAGVRPS